MRVRAGLLLLVVIAFSPAAPTLAAQPQEVTIATDGALVGGTQVGTFVATGAIADEGTYSFNEGSHEDFAFAGRGAPTFGIVRSFEFFAGQNGSFVLQNVITFSLTSQPGVFAVEGTWAVVSGTGGYAGLHGQGTITGQLEASNGSEQFQFVFVGETQSA
jgi:hypothetical protein